ncbi:MAG: PBECR4 domain-containing protein [Oscillospiraceae bacterium]|nr:PBECR4 domain-containing protein [Oscillospiraceae bacterium]
MSFKQRVCKTITSCAADYNSVFLDFDYLVYSSKFVMHPYYTISAKPGNYKHLTGVNSAITPYVFFEKCLNGTLTEIDFDFIKPHESEAFVKGVVRNKITALPLISNIFTQKLIAEENYIRGKVNCSLATTDTKITIGFEDRINARPKTLLKGNEINKAQSVNVELVLRRNRGSDRFDTIIQGDIEKLLVKFKN